MNRYDLVLLGLILEHERSGYDIITEIRDRELDRWAKISTSTVYNRLIIRPRIGSTSKMVIYCGSKVRVFVNQDLLKTNMQHRLLWTKYRAMQMQP